MSSGHGKGIPQIVNTGRHFSKRKTAVAKAASLPLLLGRLSAVSLVLFNVFAWALFGLPTEAEASAAQSFRDASATISALDLPGITADDICIAGMHMPGKSSSGAHVCPHCCPVGSGAHALLLPGEVSVPVLAESSSVLALSEPGTAPTSRPPRPWLARGPPSSSV